MRVIYMRILIPVLIILVKANRSNVFVLQV